MAVKSGDTVSMAYTARLEDGTVFDSATDEKPFAFKVGDHRVLKAVEDAVVGMEKGDEKTITIAPDQGYGGHRPEFFRKVPKASLPKDREPTVGMALGFATGDGRQFEARITDVGEQDITIDLNIRLQEKHLPSR